MSKERKNKKYAFLIDVAGISMCVMGALWFISLYVNATAGGLVAGLPIAEGTLMYIPLGGALIILGIIAIVAGEILKRK